VLFASFLHAIVALTLRRPRLPKEATDGEEDDVSFLSFIVSDVPSGLHAPDQASPNDFGALRSNTRRALGVNK